MLLTKTTNTFEKTAMIYNTDIWVLNVQQRIHQRLHRFDFSQKFSKNLSVLLASFLLLFLSACNKSQDAGCRINLNTGDFENGCVENELQLLADNNSQNAPLSCAAAPLYTPTRPNDTTDIQLNVSGGTGPYYLLGSMYDTDGGSVKQFSGEETFLFTRDYEIPSATILNDTVLVQDSLGQQSSCIFSVRFSTPERVRCALMPSNTSPQRNEQIQVRLEITGGIAPFNYSVRPNRGITQERYNSSTSNSHIIFNRTYLQTGMRFFDVEITDQNSQTYTCSTPITVSP